MNQSDHRKPVTLEDLLRVKRAEKPGADFWPAWQQRFQERRRQAALEPRVWWKEVGPRLGVMVARWHVPLGAAAVVALTFFAVREYNPTEHLTGFSGSAVTAAGLPARASDSIKAPATDVLAELRHAVADEVKAPASLAPKPGEIASAVAGLSLEEKLSPAERAIAANFAAMQALEPELAHSWRGRSLIAPAVVNPVTNALNEEPLANVTVVRDLRRSRMLGFQFQPTAGSPAYSRQQERMINRLNEEQLYEAKSSSVGARGDRLSVKF